MKNDKIRTVLLFCFFLLIISKSAYGQVVGQTSNEGFSYMREVTAQELSGMTSGLVVVLAPIDQFGRDDISGERLLIEQLFQGQESIGFVLYKASFSSPLPISKLLFVPHYQRNGKPVHDFIFYEDGREWFKYQDEGGSINLQAHFWDSLKVRLLINQTLVPSLNLYQRQFRPVKKGWRMNTTIPVQTSSVLPNRECQKRLFYCQNPKNMLL